MCYLKYLGEIMERIQLIKKPVEAEPLLTSMCKKQRHTPFITFALTSIIISGQLVIAAPITSAWSCGAWTKDKKNSCVEIQICTRSVCGTKGTISNCRNETKTSKSTDQDCTPTPTKPKARTLGKDSMSFSGIQKIKKATAGRTTPKIRPEIRNNFDEADAIFGKRTSLNKKKKGKKTVRPTSILILPTGVEKIPAAGGPIPIPYPNITTTEEDKKPVQEK